MSEKMKLLRRNTAVSFLRRKNKVLIVRRSNAVSTYQRKWCGIAGRIKKGEKPCNAALREVLEETNLKKNDIISIHEGKPFFVIDQNYGIKWKIHPFLLDVKTGKKISLNWESSGTRWIRPSEIYRYKTTPRLDETLKRALGWKSLQKKQD